MELAKKTTFAKSIQEKPFKTFVWPRAIEILLRITYLSSDVHQVGSQRRISSIQLFVFGRQGNDGALEFLNHGLFPLSGFSGADAVLFQAFLALAFLKVVVCLGR